MNEQIYIQDRGEGELIVRTLKPFPEDPEKRLDAILSCVNTEPKNITLAFCLDKEFKNSSELRSEFKRFVGNGHWVPSNGSFFEYSHRSFVPIRVAEEQIIIPPYERPVTYFRLTEDGMRYVKPIAALALRFAIDHGKSMYEYLGQTSSSGNTRSPYNKTRILELLRNGSKREVDIVNEFDLSESTVKQNLRTLDNSGLIAYNSINPEEHGWVYHIWIRGKIEDVPVFRDEPTLTKKVAKEFKRLKKANAYELTEVLGLKSNSSVTDRISRILSHITKEEFSIREKWDGHEIRSQATLLEEGGRFLDEFIMPVRKVLNGQIEVNNSLDFFSEEKIVEYSEAGMDLYKNVSPSRKRKPKELRINRIIEFVRERNQTGDAPRTEEIRGYLSGGHVFWDLRQLVKEGVLKKIRSGRVVRYYTN